MGSYYTDNTAKRALSTSAGTNLTGTHPSVIAATICTNQTPTWMTYETHSPDSRRISSTA